MMEWVRVGDIREKPSCTKDNLKMKANKLLRNCMNNAGICRLCGVYNIEAGLNEQNVDLTFRRC